MRNTAQHNTIQYNTAQSSHYLRSAQPPTRPPSSIQHALSGQLYRRDTPHLLCVGGGGEVNRNGKREGERGESSGVIVWRIW
jgi:hypothetical protein